MTTYRTVFFYCFFLLLSSSVFAQDDDLNELTLEELQNVRMYQIKKILADSVITFSGKHQNVDVMRQRKFADCSASASCSGRCHSSGRRFPRRPADRYSCRQSFPAPRKQCRRLAREWSTCPILACGRRSSGTLHTRFP